MFMVGFRGWDLTEKKYFSSPSKKSSAAHAAAEDIFLSLADMRSKK
jgi:hypothetical protein